MSGTVHFTLERSVATLTFDNPERLNALTMAMCVEVRESLEQIADDRDVRVLLLRGAGERAFMSGADVGEQEVDDRDGFLASANAMIAAVGALPIPVVAVIHGYCLGAGVAVATEADIRIASSDAKFGVPAARLGLGYPYDEVARLAALIGSGATAELLFTSRFATVAEAHAWGFVQAVHEPGELTSMAAKLATTIAENAPLSVRTAKHALRVVHSGGSDEGRREVADLVAACLASSDYAEGRAAFRARRAPRFTGS